MGVLERYKDDILRIDEFVRSLDPAVRGEAFRFLLGRATSTREDEASSKAERSIPEKLQEKSQLVFRRISEDSGVPVERLMEIYVVEDSGVSVIDSSIPNEGPTDLLKKVTLLCAYGNIVGRKIAKVDLARIYKNLKDLRADTTSYSRDVKKAEGVKVVTNGVMLPPDGREKGQSLLREILNIGT